MDAKIFMSNTTTSPQRCIATTLHFVDSVLKILEQVSELTLSPPKTQQQQQQQQDVFQTPQARKRSLSFLVTPPRPQCNNDSHRHPMEGHPAQDHHLLDDESGLDAHATSPMMMMTDEDDDRIFTFRSRGNHLPLLPDSDSLDEEVGTTRMNRLVSLRQHQLYPPHLRRLPMMGSYRPLHSPLQGYTSRVNEEFLGLAAATTTTTSHPPNLRSPPFPTTTTTTTTTTRTTTSTTSSPSLVRTVPPVPVSAAATFPDLDDDDAIRSRRRGDDAVLAISRALKMRRCTREYEGRFLSSSSSSSSSSSNQYPH